MRKLPGSYEILPCRETRGYFPFPVITAYPAGHSADTVLLSVSEISAWTATSEGLFLALSVFASMTVRLAHTCRRQQTITSSMVRDGWAVTFGTVKRGMGGVPWFSYT